MGWTKTQTWATVCVCLNKENSQGTMTLTDNKEERDYEPRRIFNAWWLMHWHQLRSQISQVFQVTSQIVGLFALHFVSPIQLLSLYQFIQFLTCTRIPCRDSHFENGLVRCCLYTLRRLQQTAVCCKRSNCNKIREKNRESRTSEVWSKDGKQRVSPFYHDLDLVGSIGNFWIVEQLLHLVVEQLLNPFLSFSHVSRKSLEEVTYIPFRIWLLQFPSEQL